MSPASPASERALLGQSAFLLLSRFAQPVALFKPDRGGGDRLAGLRSHRPRFRPRHGRTGAVPADRNPAVRRGKRRRPLRAQARGRALPARRGGDRLVSGVEHLCRHTERSADLRRDLRARHRRRVREPGAVRAVAADRTDRLAAARDRHIERRGPGCDHHRPRTRRSGLCGRAQSSLRNHRRVLRACRAPDESHSGSRRRRPSRTTPRRTISSPGSASSAAIPRFSVRFRSICSPCCSVASSRCCRSTPATSCKPARSGLACCAPRPRSARCLRPSFWPGTP